MTQVIINDILPLTQAIATGGQVLYSTDWTANYPSDVVVYSRPANTPADDATQVLAYPADYSVDFIGGGQIVQVTLVTPSTAADVVTITRQTPADRENLYSNTNFTPSMLNNDFGILTLVDQQAQLVNQQVGPRYNYSAFIEPVTDTILPILPANCLWVKNSSNTAIVAAQINTISAGSVNLGSENELAWYSATGTVVSGLLGVNSAALTTTSLGVPTWVAYTGSGAPVLATSPTLTTPTLNTPTLVTPYLGTPNNGNMVNTTGYLVSNLADVAWIDQSSNIILTGFSGTPTINWAKYKIIGKTIFFSVSISGTSNSTTFEIDLAIAAAATSAEGNLINALDNSSSVYNANWTITNGSATLSMLLSNNSTGWTSSGTKGAFFQGFYESI